MLQHLVDVAALGVRGLGSLFRVLQMFGMDLGFGPDVWVRNRWVRIGGQRATDKNGNSGFEVYAVSCRVQSNREVSSCTCLIISAVCFGSNLVRRCPSMTLTSDKR